MDIIVSGYAYPSIDPEVLSAWLPDLTFLNTFSYGITPEGGLIDLADQPMIDAANSQGVKPLMVVTPMDQNGAFSDVLASQVLSNPQARTNLVYNILTNIRAKGMAGVDFDFEFIPLEHRDQYVELVKEAKSVLGPEGYYVTVALAPKTSADQPGLLYQGHDYGGMGAVADFVLIMTYEWGYTFGPPMAVSPINQVRRVLDYAVTEIPREKLLMGMSNYGYDWPLPFVQGQTRAEKISSEEAFARAQRYGAEIQYDQISQAPYFTYTDETGRQYIVWFEDIRSFRARLALVEEYGLAGIGVWNIMDYFAAGNAILREMYGIRKM